jgi:hypothetical protein
VTLRNADEAAKAHALGEDDANRTKHYRDIEAQRAQFAKMCVQRFCQRHFVTLCACTR